jgi:TonB family protein
VVPPPPVEKVQPPPPQPVVIDKRKQMVDQTRFPEEPDNAEAKYLAQTNHRAAQDTRMESTNLIRESNGAERTSQANENQDKNAGEREQKIAELENKRGTDLPREAPQQGKEGQSQDPRERKPGPLAMRNLIPRATERNEVQQREGVERQEREAGELPMQRKGQDGQRAGASKKGGDKPQLTLDHHAYDNIEGFATAERERHEAAKAERSHVRGRYDRYNDKLTALRSSLENFTPDVKLGNQAELGTRASPFAGYITAMHRQIHKIFTFGFLADQEGKLGRGAFEDETLWTQVQIALNPDGTVDKLGIVRASGNVAFDAVAIDSVMSAAPFPKPPQAIRSANGKVYMDWQFHRDERACGTFGVDPHILTTPAEGIQHDTTETGAGIPKRTTHAAAPANARAPLLPSGGEDEGPRHLQREPEKPPAVAPSVPDITSEVQTAAEGWFAAWTRGDVSWLAGWSAVPFQAGGHVAARTPDALKNMYKQMLAEVDKRKCGPIEILTPGGVRAKTGGLPPGGEEGGMLFAVAESGGERFVLLLRKSDQGWRVAGLVR